MRDSPLMQLVFKSTVVISLFLPQTHCKADDVAPAMQGQLRISTESEWPVEVLRGEVHSEETAIEIQAEAQTSRTLLAVIVDYDEIVGTQRAEGRFRADLRGHRRFNVLLTSGHRVASTYSLRAVALRETERTKIVLARDLSRTMTPTRWSELKQQGKRARASYSPPPAHEEGTESVAGTLSPETSVCVEEEKKLLEVFTFRLADRAEYLDVNLISEAFDGWLMVVSPSGDCWVDDDSGEGRNSRVLIQRAPQGQWQVVATSYRTNAEGTFRLHVQALRERERTRIEVARDSRGTMTPTRWSELKQQGKRAHVSDPPSPEREEGTESVVGTLSAEASLWVEEKKKLLEVFTFQLGDTAGHLDVNLVSEAFDSWLMVVSPSGDCWVDDNSGQGRNSRVLVVPAERGQWQVVATSSSGNAEGSFRLHVEAVREERRPITLASETDLSRFLHVIRMLTREFEPRTLSGAPDHGALLWPREGPDELRALIRYLQERDRAYEERFERMAAQMDRQARMMEERSRMWELQLAALESQRVSSNLDLAQAVPSFPWPPPQASAVAVIPKKLLTSVDSATTTTLAQVNAELIQALVHCGYHERRYYAAPEGFALVTRIEQIDSEGRPKAPRWSIEVGPLRRFSLSAYVQALFTAPRGHYRVLVFLITAKPFATTGDPPTRREADQWLAEGLNALPTSIGELQFTADHRMTTLVYEFEKLGHEGSVDLLVPGNLQGNAHLRGSGVLVELEGR